MTRRLLMVALVALAAWSMLPGTAGAAFVGTNGKLAFSSARNGFPADNDLYTMNADGTVQTRITSLDQDELNPNWSPDGTKVVFERTAGLRGDIYSALANGTSQVQLTTSPGNDIRPAWSFTGGQIVFASDRDSTAGTYDIFTMNANGTNQVNITNTPTINEDYPAWQPNGNSIAFSRDGNIYTMTSAGTNLAQLTTATTNETEPDWSPSGGQIVYQAGVTTVDEIWKMNANGTGQVNLTNNVLADEAPVWSPAGDKIAFIRDAFKNAEVYTMNGDGTGALRITNNTLMDNTPAWQPIPPPTGTITVLLDAQPNHAQDFAFTAGGGLSPASFSLDDDADGTLSNMRVFSGLTPGSGRSIAQTVPSGWDLTGSSCDDGSPITNINVSAGEFVTCTFTNRKRGQVVVVEDSQPNASQDFAFTAGGGLSPTSFSLDDDADGTLSNTRTFASLVPNNGYTLAHTPPAGWFVVSATCSDGSPISNIDVGPDETVTCTFIHQLQGSLTIVKDALPNDPQDFSFSVGGGLSPASFSLDDDSDGTLSNTRTFANIHPATYSASETPVPAGWSLTSATCSDGSPVTAIVVDVGESVTCTFTNQRQAQIVVVEDATPNDAQDFAFTAGGGLSPTSFSLDDDADGTLSNTRTFTGVAPGSGYSLAQTAPAGWDLSSATCSDGSPITNINVSSNEVVTCTFAHAKRGQITILKNAVPDDAQDFAFTAGGGLSPTSFSLDDDANATLSNTRVFTNVAAGSGYSVAETVPSGWDQASAICSDASPVTNISISAGESVTCTFTNNKRGSIVVVEDAQPNDAQDFAFTAGGGLSPTSFSLDDDADGALSNTRTFANVAVGSGYTLAQSAPAGWDLSTATCNDGSPISNINVAAAEVVTCTFTHLKRGQITVVKDATPDDAQDFSFTAGGGLSPTSFQLDDDTNGTLSNTRVFTNVAAGSGYSLAETVPAGWDQTSATCSDGSPVTNVNLSAAESVTCTFANRKRGQIIAVKDATPDDAQDFSFTAGGGLSPTSFQLDNDADGTLSNTRTFADLVPGSAYSLSETVPTGWDQTSATCSDASPVTAINVAAGEVVTCTFANRKRGQINVVVDAVPDDAQDFAFTAGGGLSPTSFSLDDDSNGTLSNTQTFSNLPVAAGYTLAQTVPSGWDLASSTCSDGSPITNINVAAGEVITCTFTNNKRGSITVVKDATPNDAQDFAFTAGGGLSPTSFSLDDDSDGTLSNTRAFTNLVPGSGFSVSETVPSGWDQTSAICSDASAVSNISISPGENVTCTFSNRKRGQIVVVKDATPDDPQDFDFTAGGGLSPASFQLDDDTNGTLSNTRTYTNVVPGSGFSVSETVPTGWDQTSATCNDGSPVSNIDVGAGETVTCTFANRKRGQIVVVKDATPDDPQDFDFTAGGGLSPTSFQLDDDTNGTLSNTRTFANVVPGSGFSLAETVPTGWDQTSATCNDGSPVTNVNVAAGEVVTCTFANRKRAQLTVVKNSVPDDPQDFDFTAGGGLSPASFQLDDDSNGTLSNTRTFANVVPGSGFSLAETVPASWQQLSASCDDGSPVSNISLSAGENVTCTFTNQPRGNIVIVQDTTPNDAQDFSYTAGGGLTPTSFSLDDDSDGTLSNTRTFANLAPGSGFSVAQSVPSGWYQNAATCNDGSPVSNISVAPGETVTCTFDNRRRGTLIVVENAVPNDAQDFAFTAGGSLTPSSFSLDDDSDGTLTNSRTFADVLPGSGYSLSNSSPAGWEQVSATCNDGSPLSNIAIADGETVTCTFTHNKQGSITVVKDATPEDPQDFSFTAGGGLSPASFQLDDDSNGTLSNTRTFGSLSPQSGYSVSEGAASGWDLTSATCDDGSPVSNIDVAAGENVTCTFSNRKRSRIIVVKDAQPDDAQDFNFTAGGGLSPTSFDLDDDPADGTLQNSHTFDDLTPASGYSVAETPAVGWIPATATCSDGSPVSDVNVAAGETVTCTFVNKRGYVRPKGAHPFKVPMVLAYDECTSPNRLHGPPYIFGSCNPPSHSSPHLTIGSPDANGAGANMIGSVIFRIVVGDAGTPADEADVTITTNVTDIRVRSDNTDYVGELQARVMLRITDRLSGPSLTDAATVQDVPFTFTLPCTATGSATIGSTCGLVSTMDAVMPGMVPEGKRSIWQISDDVRVTDGGPDGLASTQNNSQFLKQGIYVP